MNKTNAGTHSDNKQAAVRYHAKYVMEMMKTSRTNAPAATPYTQVFSFPSAGGITHTHTHTHTHKHLQLMPCKEILLSVSV